jgi:PAS domain S-box-containing protein
MGGPRIKSTADLVAAAGRAAAGHAAAEQVRSSALIDASPDAIVVVGADGRLVVFNRAAEELTGWRSGEVLGKVMAEVLIPEPARPAVAGGMRAYLESGDPGEFVGRVRMPILCADGTQRMTELTPVPVTIEGNVHFCGFLRDVGDLEQANAALRESEARFRVLSELAPVGIVMTDLNGMYTFANVRWCAMTGMTMSQALSARWPTGIHPDDVERLEQEWQRAAAMDTELRTDCRLQGDSGGEVWAHLSMIPVLDGDGQRSGSLGAVTNVSERKRAEAEKERLLNAERAARRSLADQTERLNGLVAAAIPGILMDDEHGRITQINQSFCDLLGISAAPSELIGTSTTRIAIRIRRVFADPSEFLRRARELVDDRLPVALDEIACADGRTLEWDFAPVFVDGCYRGNLWGVADATERTALAEQRERLLAAELAAREAAEEAQARLAEQNARLQALDEAKTQFISTMSHELRTPLTSIISFAELILDKRDKLAPDTVSSLSVIQRNAGRLMHLVGELLLLSRLEQGVLPLDLEVVSVPELVAEAVSSASASAAEHGITIDVAIAAGPALRADPLRLQQVLGNLLSNAVKYTGQGGKVRVKGAYDGQRWQIAVADNGMGIPADELGSLFDRFVRASNARTAGLPGTGLGLAVVKAITELHGGSVEVRSVMEHGTVFTIYLPVSA